MPEVDGEPHEGNARLGAYGGSNPVSESAALCEQLRNMQKDMMRMMRNSDELQSMMGEVLETMQHQNASMQTLVRRVDRATENGDEAVEIMKDAAESIRQNTLFIMKSTMILAHVMGDDEQVAIAEEKAKRKIQEWQKETQTLALVSSNGSKPT